MSTQSGLVRRINARSQARHLTAALAASALVVGLSAPTAAVSAPVQDGHALPLNQESELIGGNFGLDMRLDSATTRSYDLDDDEEEFVLFCFRDGVQRILEEDFFVAGFASGARESATFLRVLETDSDCVLAGFPPGTDLRQFSVGGVAPGVVRNADGEVNLPDTVTLDGASPSRSAGPVLIDVEGLNRTLNRASLVFDEILDETGADADGFGYYTRSGIAHRADRVISIKDETVVLEWDEADGDEVEDGIRFFVEDAAVQGRQGFGSFTGGVGGDTAAPDLDGVGRASDGVWSFRFDDPVVAVDAGGFVLYTQNGERFEGSDADSDDRGTVHVTFDGVADFDEQVIHAATESGAVRGIAAGDFPNTIGSIVLDARDGFDRVDRLGSSFGRFDRDNDRSGSLGRDDAFDRLESDNDRVFDRNDSFRRNDASSRFESDNDRVSNRGNDFGRFDRTNAGFTAGPDLIDVDIDESDGLVAYDFDQNLGDDAMLEADRFFLLTPAGELVRGLSIAQFEDDVVVVLFGQVLAEDAIAAGVLEMAVSDEHGNENLARTVVGPGTRGFGFSRDFDRSSDFDTFD